MNYSEVFDSRDAQERIEELQEQEERDEDEQEELDALLALKEETESSGWEYGIGFIADSYFQEYAEELATDIGAIQPGAQWPNNCIDWEQAARELQMDYSSIEFMGETYWWREA